MQPPVLAWALRTPWLQAVLADAPYRLRRRIRPRWRQTHTRLTGSRTTSHAARHPRTPRRWWSSGTQLVRWRSSDAPAVWGPLPHGFGPAQSPARRDARPRIHSSTPGPGLRANRPSRRCTQPPLARSRP